MCRGGTRNSGHCTYYQMSIRLRAMKNVWTVWKQRRITNLQDLGGIAKLMGFTQDGINSIEEVGTQETTPGRESVKYTWNNQSSEDNMQLFDNMKTSATFIGDISRKVGRHFDGGPSLLALLRSATPVDVSGRWLDAPSWIMTSSSNTVSTKNS